MKKVLCMGNCHLAAIGKWLDEFYSDKFQVIDCEDCGLEPFWSSKSLSIWTPENQLNQNNFYKNIHETLKHIDIFLFQHMRQTSTIDQLLSSYLCSEIATNSINVCIANTRSRSYPICNITLEPYINHIKQKEITTPEEIYDYFHNVDDSAFYQIHTLQQEQEKKENIEYAVQAANLFSNFINPLEFLQNNWSKHLLFQRYNHPTKLYWIELIKQLFTLINEDLDISRLEHISYPGKPAMPDVRKVKFFNNVCPNIQMPDGANIINIPQRFFL